MNDIIVKVGNVDVSNTTHTAAVEALKKAGSRVILVSFFLLAIFFQQNGFNFLCFILFLLMLSSNSRYLSLRCLYGLLDFYFIKNQTNPVTKTKKYKLNESYKYINLILAYKSGMVVRVIFVSQNLSEGYRWWHFTLKWLQQSFLSVLFSHSFYDIANQTKSSSVKETNVSYSNIKISQGWVGTRKIFSFPLPFPSLYSVISSCRGKGVYWFCFFCNIKISLINVHTSGCNFTSCFLTVCQAVKGTNRKCDGDWTEEGDQR